MRACARPLPRAPRAAIRLDGLRVDAETERAIQLLLRAARALTRRLRLSASASVPRSRRGRNLKRRVFILPVRGRGRSLILLKPVLWSCSRLQRPPVSCGPTLLAPSLKVQRDRIHNPPPGTIFLPRGCGFTDETLTKEIRPKDQHRARGFGPTLDFPPRCGNRDIVSKWLSC